MKSTKKEKGPAQTPGAEKGPGGGAKHESQGRGSEQSGAAKRRNAERQRTLRGRAKKEAEAEKKAADELDGLKQSKTEKDFKLILGDKTEAEWIHAKKLEILGRKKKG